MDNSQKKIDYTKLTFEDKVKLINEADGFTKSSLIFNIAVNSSENDVLKIIEMYAYKINRREYEMLANSPSQ